MRSSRRDARRLLADGDTSADSDSPGDPDVPADPDVSADATPSSADSEHPSPPPAPRFSDVQRVRDTDLFVSLFVTLFPTLVLVAGAVLWSAPTDPRALAGLAAITLVVAACLAFAYATRLVVTVDDDGLTVHVEPFDRRPLTVTHAEITDYRVEPDTPTGHGIALGSGRHAWWLDSITYGVGDGECVHVDRADGRPVHVGSARAAELVAALDQANDGSTGTTTD
ncbi:hypothetical protein [Salinirubrum litoreum]|uniref:PH domain-containing protein n=1 Tax=Salinirubrum litoreum TaxID=1126234 RepID=A0ABD5R772_9EURY|nr:hypothetical protein [Salinirubrum litoreum]